MSELTPVLLDAHASAAFLGISLRQLRNLQRLPDFPAPRSLGPRSTRWLRTELEHYALALPSVKQRDEPAQLAAARADKAAGLAPLPGPFSHAPAAHQPG